MKSTLVTNNTKNTMHVGPHTIYPGQSRSVQRCFLKVEKSIAEPSLEEWLSDFVKQKQDDEIQALPNLTFDQLYALEVHYSNENPPKKLKAALPIEVESRGEAFEIFVFAKELAEMDDADLSSSLFEYADDEARLAAVQSELNKRSEDEH